MRIVRDVLDKKLLDSENCEMGRVDGITLEIEEGKQPRLVTLEIGGEILAERVGHWLIKPVRWLANHFGPRRAGAIKIDWKHVERMGRDIHLDLKADETEALAWEHWLAEKFIRHIPGGS